MFLIIRTETQSRFQVIIGVIKEVGSVLKKK